MAGLLQNIDLIGDELPWLHELRQSGREAFSIAGVPTAKTEAWKYTKPRELNADDFVAAQPANPGNWEADLPFDCYKIRFENGFFSPAGSDLPQGVEVVPLIEAALFRPEVRKYLGALADVKAHPFAALNQAYLNEGVYIKVDSNVELKKPIALISHTTPHEQNLFFNLRNLIVLGKNSAATFVEYHSWSGELKSRYFANVVNEIYLADSSRLQHCKLQDEAYKADHIALSVVAVENNASYNSFCLQRGANLSRNETLVKLLAEGANAEVNAAYVMNGWATLDTTTNIEHLAPNTISHQLVKGVVGGDAKGVFQGKIHIAPHAVKTEGNQLHKALLLTDTAEVDVKPELEIYADDVKCSHGAASGELDENQLFYMRSRGIGLEEAKQLLIDAYLNEVIAKIGNEKIREWIKLWAQANHTV